MCLSASSRLTFESPAGGSYRRRSCQRCCTVLGVALYRKHTWIVALIHGWGGREFSEWGRGKGRPMVGREWPDTPSKDLTRSRPLQKRHPRGDDWGIGHLRCWSKAQGALQRFLGRTSPKGVVDIRQACRVDGASQAYHGGRLIRNLAFLSAPVTRSKLPVIPPAHFPLLDENPRRIAAGLMLSDRAGHKMFLCLSCGFGSPWAL